ncbi:MAG TPA: ATP-binding protein [Sulfurospirillum sp. UBA11407]|nr:MAG TPA: ATP-binding protein [Sulfurospirillum sp. UBA11407]
MEKEVLSDERLLQEVQKRFDEKNATLKEMEFLTKKLYDLNQKLKDTDKVKGEFLSLIKNVFNNPMSSLLNLSRMMQKNEDSPQTQKIKAFIQTELLKLDFQLNNIFTAAEIEAGETSNYFSEVNVETIFDEALSSFEYLIEQKSLHVQKEINIGVRLVSDAKKLRTILLNIISNACEYSFRNQEIKFVAAIDENNLFLNMHNVGDVISKEHKKEVFNRFQKVDKNSKARESVEGLGLGLSVVNALVESLGGEVDYESSEEETVFQIKIHIDIKDEASSCMNDSANEFLFDDFDDMKEF